MVCIRCSSSLPEGARVCPSCHTLQPLGDGAGALGPGATRDLGYGRVVLEARIGDGGMGVVWRAWLFFAPDGPRGQEAPLALALKVLRAEGDGAPGLRTLFVNEAEALRQLRHPNIVAFHDFFDWNGAPALAMELVVGSTVRDLVSRHRARAALAGAGATPGVPLRRAWYYVQQLLGALAATHALGVVHRDVKPSNVLLRNDGIVKLGDYGIARLAGAVTDEALGTGAYMAPEQVLGRPVDARSDLYAAAIVLYEMLVGRPPFSPDEKSEFLVRRDQVETPPPPLRDLLPGAPVALERVLARALAKEPAYRFASAVAMGDAIQAALGEADAPAWQAQRAFADHAAPPLGEAEPARSLRAVKLATLHDEVVLAYKAASPSR